MKVLVTGASGFVGKHLCVALKSAQIDVIAARRDNSKLRDDSVARVGDIDAETDWSAALEGVDVVVHLAARVHIMSETANSPLAEFRKVNVLGTQRLGRCAAEAGVRRFIYISTIKVLGERTENRPFLHTDTAKPCDPYALSKLEAEQALMRIEENSGLDLVILRPPLIYGPGVGGNFLRILNLIYRGIPLPFGLIRNARSMLAVSNFCDVIKICLDHPDATGETFLIADGSDTSTPNLFRMIGDRMGKSARLVPFPKRLLKLVGKLFRRSSEIDRLCGSLQVDIEHTKRILNWSPRTSLEEGVHSVVDWYLAMRSRTYD